MHEHYAPSVSLPVTLIVIGVGLACFLGAYVAAALRSARLGRAWPAWRTGCAVAGVAAALTAVGPLMAAGHHDFVSHMWGHLLLGMAAPLLLAVSSPVRLLLRGLPVEAARRLSAALSTPYVRIVAHPLVAATLNIGGLWLLYSTPLYSWMHSSTVVGLLVHVHVLLAGWVFTASILQVDPAPHPVGHPSRAAVLVAFLGLHAILAKRIYAVAPVGVPAADAQTGSQVMYYGGDYIDLVLIALFCLDWYRRSAPRPRAVSRPVTP